MGGFEYPNPYGPVKKYGPQEYGQRVNVVLADPPAALGFPTFGREVQVLKLERDDDACETVDITLSASQYAPNSPVPAPNPLSELVGIVTWGQHRADSNGQFFGSGAGLMPGVPPGPIRCELDWQHGTVLSVPASSVQVWARWDNWDVAGVNNPAPGAVGYPFTRWVQAMLSPHGHGHHNLRPQRTTHFWNPIAPAGFDGRQIPAFARSVRLVSPAGTTWTLRLQRDFGVTILASLTVVGGTVSPELPVPNGTEWVRVDNVGAVAGTCALIWDLGL